MVWFLDKPFEFESMLSLEQCEQFIGTLPKRKRRWSHNTVILADAPMKHDEHRYALGRYMQRDVY